MRILAAIAGLALILLVAREAFETVVLPRRVASRIRLVSLYYLATRRAWAIVGHRVRLGAAREDILSYYGPLSLLGLVALWAILFIVAFAALFWGLALPLAAPDKAIGFATYLYLSGSTFFTLGPGNVVVASGPGRLLEVLEVALGLGFLALMIGYVPVLYQAFSRRELRISLLDARAGSPANAAGMLRRNCAISDVDGLQRMLNEWEPWCADILESHLSYPLLAFYRSQHERQSWVEALTVILDVCALILTGIEGIPAEPAKFVFAIARHTAVDLAQVFGSPPMTGVQPAAVARVCPAARRARGGGPLLQGWSRRRREARRDPGHLRAFRPRAGRQPPADAAALDRRR